MEDLGSTNGTLVDGRRITEPVTLLGDATVMVGQTELSVELGSADTGVTAVRSSATAMRPVPPRPDPAPEPAAPPAAAAAAAASAPPAGGPPPGMAPPAGGPPPGVAPPAGGPPPGVASGRWAARRRPARRRPARRRPSRWTARRRPRRPAARAGPHPRLGAVDHRRGRDRRRRRGRDLELGRRHDEDRDDLGRRGRHGEEQQRQEAREPPGVTIVPLASGTTNPFVSDRTLGNGSIVKVSTCKDTGLAMQQETFQPGAALPWHKHPGAGLAIVVQGTINDYVQDGKGCKLFVVKAGQDRFDPGDNAHELVNHGKKPVILVAFGFAPPGAAEGVIPVKRPPNCKD